MTAPLDYLAHLARESARFVDASDAAAPVPSCPDWTAADLLWHLAEVQWLWGTIVRDRVDADAAEQFKPARPASWAGLHEFFLSASEELCAVLARTPPETTVWTWAEDKTAGFVRRRQAHEALIHRVDAELTVRDRTPLDPALSADGADEALMIMFGGDLPDWGIFAAEADKVWSVMDRVERNAPSRIEDAVSGRPMAGPNDPNWSGWVGATFFHVHYGSHDQVIDRARSVSHIAALPAAAQHQVLAEIRTVLDGHPETRQRPTIGIPYRVDAMHAERIG